METIEKSRLIAEFMESRSSIVTEQYFGHDGFLYYPQDMRYHFSWDWLMPVVAKIEKDLKEEFRVVILEDECSIYQKTEDRSLQIEFVCVASAEETSKIDATFDAVVEFIEWYNKKAVE